MLWFTLLHIDKKCVCVCVCVCGGGGGGGGKQSVNSLLPSFQILFKAK